MVNRKPQKKRILYFVPQFPVLSETFIEREVSKLVEFGNLDLQIVSLQPGTGALSENLEGKIEYVNLSLFDCLKAFISYILLSPKKALEAHKLISGDDKTPYFLSSGDSSNPRSKTSVLGKFHNSRLIHYLKGLGYAKVFERYNPDHIHAQFLSDSSTICMVAAKVLDLPFSISAHAIDVFVEGTLIPIKAREATFISVCNGNTWSEVVKQANLTKSSGKVKLMFHGINTEKLFSGEPWEKPAVPVILSIGRLVEKKGHEYLIKASRILKDHGVVHQIRIGGGGPLYQELFDLIKSLNVADTVEIIGQSAAEGPTNKQVGSLMQSADIYSAQFIVASTGDRDGLPTTVIEAALARLPIVATAAGSMRDLITGETGIVVPEKDPEALATAFEKLLSDKELRQNLASKVNIAAKKNFNIERNVKELEDLFLV